MRSTSSRTADEGSLPLGLPAPEPRVRRTRAKTDAPTEFEHRLGSGALASQGLPAGTVVIVDTARRPQRGDIVFARIRGRLKVGVLGTQLGRSVLRADTESFWIDHTTDVWGVAIAADPPLDALF
jgi:hypothetical protein